MPDPEQIIQENQNANPAGEVVSPSPGPAETAVVQPADDQDLVTFQTELENAKTPEEKEQARRGYQQRQEAKTRRETERRELESQLAVERARRETYERVGAQQVQPQQVQEPQIPGPQLPPRPDASQWTVDGYEDVGKQIEVLSKWQADCRLLEYQHQQRLEQARTENLRHAQESQNFINEVVTAHPDFADKMFLHQPTREVGVALGILSNIDRKAAIETAYYLVNNPTELQRVNSLPKEAAMVVLGQIAKQVTLPPLQPKAVSAAPEPAKPVVSTETKDEFDPYNADMETRGRHHPATANLPWLR